MIDTRTRCPACHKLRRPGDYRPEAAACRWCLAAARRVTCPACRRTCHARELRESGCRYCEGHDTGPVYQPPAVPAPRRTPRPRPERCGHCGHPGRLDRNEDGDWSCWCGWVQEPETLLYELIPDAVQSMARV